MSTIPEFTTLIYADVYLIKMIIILWVIHSEKNTAKLSDSLKINASTSNGFINEEIVFVIDIIIL